MNHRAAGQDEAARRVPNRRERRRQATLDEIVQTARSLLYEGRAVTFRALGEDMGLTPSALYRYVDSIAGINELISNAIFVEVVGEMSEAGAPYGDQDPAAQMVAAATTFRCWALENKAEFKLVFTTTALSGEGTTRSASGDSGNPLSRGFTGGATRGVEMFADLFGQIFVRLREQRRFQVPAPDELDEDFVAVYTRIDGGPDTSTVLGENALGMIWLFELSWAQLFGIVTLEVFGHVRPHLVPSGAFFRAQIREIGMRVGMDEDWDRLIEVSKEVLGRRASGSAASS